MVQKGWQVVGSIPLIRSGFESSNLFQNLNPDSLWIGLKKHFKNLQLLEPNKMWDALILFSYSNQFRGFYNGYSQMSV